MPAAQLADGSLDVSLLLATLRAFKKGDFSARMPLDWTGMAGKVADTLNDLIETNERMSKELARLSRVVGGEGRMGQRASMGDVTGAWAEDINSINTLLDDLTSPATETARVIGAVARGDFSQTMSLERDGVPLQGNFLQTAQTVNAMVAQLGSFASEVTRVAREVGTDGKLGGQAEVAGVSGIWKDLTDNVNRMAANLTDQVRSIATVTTAVVNGDLSKKITVDARGELLELKNTINIMVDQLGSFAGEVTRVAREVGTEGKLGGQAVVKGVSGTWNDLTDNVNYMAANLTNQVRSIAKVTTAVANGDLSRKITVDAKGEMLELKNTINTMVDQLGSFASEVTRVAREVGTEGKLGGQAMVRGVAGTWKDLTDNVDRMAANLTSQVRGITKVVTAVANGNLKQKLTVEAKGEIAALADTINSMIDTLATFADQVTTVAREVGVEGKLGGQASVPGAAGTWKDLTDNVNRLAANLTTQVRAIAEVSTAVTKGELTRSIQVEASGEVAALKDNLNEMIGNLRDTIQKNAEQDWLKTNLAKFTRMLQGQRDLTTVSKLILSELAPLLAGQHGVLYLMEAGKEQGQGRLKLLATYAYKERKNLSTEFRIGEGLVGQCALEKQRILLSNAPPDYVQITSGLGQAPPLNIIVLPVLFEGQVRAVVELASFERFTAIHQAFLDQLTDSIGVVLNTIQANTRTEELLNQSQTMAQELQSQQEELEQTNEELEEKAKLLSDQKAEVERKNREVEVARQALEEKAAQLALTSKYKSEFLSNMSHELRTPLNSLMMLAQQLAENSAGNLTEQQVRFAQTIGESGGDLLNLINEILDLSKIESGKATLEVSEVAFREVGDHIERTFRPVAEGKGLDFEIELDRDLPRSISTDAKRLQQVLKNLLSNAFKFTEKGRVELRIAPATAGWSALHEGLNRAKTVIAFVVGDTGVGIPLDKQRLIFEAFQQADGTTSRKYGGTGLGLSISREIAALLGGEIRLVSAAGKGSTFTLYLPQGLTPGPAKPGRSFAREREAQPVRPEFSPVSSGAQRRGRNPGSSLPAVAAVAALDVAGPELQDDRDDVRPGDRVLLMVEDDADFAPILLERAHKKGFKGIVARRGEDALAMAQQYQPDAITLDLHLPDMDGWLVLDRLKHLPETRHIPVHIISCDAGLERGLRAGAIAHLAKPVTKEALDEALSGIKSLVERREKFLLVVEPQEADRQAVLDLIGSENVRTTAVGSGAEALAALEEKPFDCVVLGLELPDMSGFQLLDEIRRRPALRALPVVVYSDKGLTQDEETQLSRAAKASVVKEARSPEQLLEEATLFLHQVEANLPESKRQMLEQLHATDPSLAGRKVLVVDDDVRNIFALTSLLEHHGLEVVSAESGKQAIQILESMPGIDGVLMDVMMPEMDGHETMKAIRQIPRFRALPMIAVTARAMKGDREKCLEAGASEYISKPVDPERLLSLLRVWLYRSEGNPE